ncbi:MAG: signal peptidase II [Phycisphaerae bacterium]|nr:signal peptidase II [Phycisphaerae bacterium]
MKQARLGRAARHPPSHVRFWSAAGLGVLADLLSKWYACKNLVVGESHEVIPGILDWTLGYNPGIAFGIELGWWVILFAVVVGIVLVMWLFFTSDKSAVCYHIGLGLILAGALGNLVDRLREPRQVRDFIDFSFWPTFNLADALLCVGVAMVGLWILRGRTERS